MNKMLAVFFGSLMIFAASVPYSMAQDEGMDEEIEIEEAFEGGQGMGPGGRQGGGPGMMQGQQGPMGGPGMRQGQMGGPGAGQRQVRVKVRKNMRQGMGEGGRFEWQDDGGGEDKLLDLIKKHDPSFHGKMLKMRESAPAKYRVAMKMSGKTLMMAKMEQDPVLEKNAVRMLALEYETRELSMAYEKAKDSEKAKIKADLKKGLSELFDLRLGHQEVRVKKMEKDLSRLKSQIEKRKSSKAKLVEGRLEQMTGEAVTW